MPTAPRPRALAALLCCLAAALLLHACAVRPPAGPARHPNLLLVFPDQMRGQAMGFLGEEPVQTPVLDRFAQQGLVLTHAVSNYPVCSPFRAMLMSGCWPWRNGVLANCNTQGAGFGYELPRDQRCWSDVLHDQGYALGYIGKWHLDAPRPPYVASSNNTAEFAWNEWCSPDRRHGFDFWHAYGTFDVHNAPEYWTTDMARDDRLKVYGRPDSGRRGVRTHRYTLMVETADDAPTRIVLHDNQADPWQLRDAAPAHPEVVRQLVDEELLPWLARAGDPWRVPPELLLVGRSGGS